MRQWSVFGPLQVGTGFSGSDVTHHVLRTLVAHWAEVLDVKVPFKFSFACEADPRKRVFLREQFPDLDTIFCDMEHLALISAKNDVTGLMTPVPFVHVFIGGFVCVDRSKLNVRRAQKKHCVQEGKGKTGSSFAMVHEYLLGCRPWVFILENVTDLGAKTDDKAQSDMEFIVSECRELAYDVKVLTINAQEYGSVAVRTRHFYLGYQDTESFACAAGRGADIYTTLQQIKIPPLPVSAFLPRLSDVRVSDKHIKRPRIDPAYKDDHLAIYRESNLEWPPDLKQMPPDFVQATRALSEREAEIAYLLEQTEPYPGGVGVCQFVDLNKSLMYLLGKEGNKTAFSEFVPTLSSSTHLWMRCDNGPGKGKSWMLLPNIYLMSFVGWDMSFYKKAVDEDLLLNLAGNAFSAFSIGAVLTGLMVHFPFPTDDESCSVSSGSN